ncbi:MAG: SIMPL domain-containing protein [Firmicutes bacterium]|nr:SIMPL domain-containing protein [Bacillota bacterium]
MKNLPGKIGFGFCGLVLLLSLVFFMPTVAAGEPRLITVLGEAEVKVTPDEVVIAMAVETSHRDIAAAKKANDTRVRNIIALAEQFQVEPAQIQTGQLSIEPRYRDNYEKKEFIAYFVRKSIVVRLTDLTKFEDLLSSFLAAGVNYIEGIQFRRSDLAKYQEQAQAEAVRAAQAKAARLAKELGQTIGRPHRVQEERTNVYPVATVPNLSFRAYDGTAETWVDTLAPGEISIRSAFTVSFALE